MMGYRRPCSLCRQTIDSTCGRGEATNWRALYQLLQFKDGATELVEPAQIYLRGDVPYTHLACWSLVVKVADLEPCEGFNL